MRRFAADTSAEPAIATIRTAQTIFTQGRMPSFCCATPSGTKSALDRPKRSTP
ncbi:hypothetical protein FHR33_008327 [Nonomuraea dietziae]|uniref:Uncharacterized protein n=1 Tax=Nonomuraea dietziae TaxID=65515 RepID=A0A7W5VQF1_9ACTN|nr:hypothetical protein [Nonomuraea dietziae]